jgi:hypothetical protein
MTKRPNFSSKQWLFVGFLSLVFLYSLFQARFIILGPEIKISTPKNGASVPAGLVMIEGTAHNVAWITLDDRQIFTDEKGYWKEKLIASPGTSIITLKARDRFGRTKTKSVEIYAQ